MEIFGYLSVMILILWAILNIIISVDEVIPSYSIWIYIITTLVNIIAMIAINYLETPYLVKILVGILLILPIKSGIKKIKFDKTKSLTDSS